MRRSQLVVLAVTWVLSLVLVGSLIDSPVEARSDLDGHAPIPEAYCADCAAPLFPATDDPEVAKTYATAYLVTRFLEMNENAPLGGTTSQKTDAYIKLTKGIREALD